MHWDCKLVPAFLVPFAQEGLRSICLPLVWLCWAHCLTVIASICTNVSLPDMVGILCGATTNTPALGAAQQTLKQMGLESNTPALGCAVAYPLGRDRSDSGCIDYS